jgi:hypothetical protein
MATLIKFGIILVFLVFRVYDLVRVGFWVEKDNIHILLKSNFFTLDVTRTWTSKEIHTHTDQVGSVSNG